MNNAVEGDGLMRIFHTKYRTDATLWFNMNRGRI